MPDEPMPERRPDPVRQPVVPLEYHREISDVPKAYAISSLVFGGLVGGGAVTFTGVISALSVSPIGSAAPAAAWPFAAAFGILGIVITIFAIRHLRRRSRTLASWFVGGLLLGVGIAGLIEGTCFGLLMR